MPENPLRSQHGPPIPADNCPTRSERHVTSQRKPCQQAPIRAPQTTGSRLDRSRSPICPAWKAPKPMAGLMLDWLCRSSEPPSPSLSGGRNRRRPASPLFLPALQGLVWTGTAMLDLTPCRRFALAGDGRICSGRHFSEGWRRASDRNAAWLAHAAVRGLSERRSARAGCR